ncbi:MAG: hypothetical protein IID45_10005 [Planctomycetes bacterium]|nr:hypothetical protein [Planctomycetota bacterium]
MQTDVILMQKEELELQRNELELTRKELSRTADAQEDSKAALQKQVELLRNSAVIQATTALAQAYGSGIGQVDLMHYMNKSAEDRLKSMTSNVAAAHYAYHTKQLEKHLAAAESRNHQPGETE